MNYLKLSRKRLDRLIAASPWFILFGFVTGGLAWVFDTAGLVTAFTSIFLGAALGAVDSYDRERGIWMLALLFFSIVFPLWLLIASSEVVAWRRGGNLALPLVLDFALGTHLLWLQSRVCWSVVCYNRRELMPTTDSRLQSD